MRGRHVVLKQLRLGHGCSAVSGVVCPILTLPGHIPDAFCWTHLKAEAGCIPVSSFGWTQKWKVLFSELSIHLTQPPQLNLSTHIPFLGLTSMLFWSYFPCPFPVGCSSCGAAAVTPLLLTGLSNICVSPWGALCCSSRGGTTWPFSTQDFPVSSSPLLWGLQSTPTSK